MVKSGTFRQIGFAAARNPDGSFMQSVPIYIDEETAPKEVSESIGRALAALFASTRTDAARGGAA